MSINQFQVKNLTPAPFSCTILILSCITYAFTCLDDGYGTSQKPHEILAAILNR